MPPLGTSLRDLASELSGGRIDVDEVGPQRQHHGGEPPAGVRARVRPDQALAEQLAHPEPPLLLAVRTEREWNAGRVETAQKILPSPLRERFSQMVGHSSAWWTTSGRHHYLLAVRQVVLLRGINLGPRNRIPMLALREQLSSSGFEDIRTYLQSGNVVLSSELEPERLAGACKRAIAEGFTLDLDVLVRTRDELAAIVARNPLREVADNPKRYQVTFLAGKLDGAELETLSSLAVGGERLVVVGREVYAWHPEGVARSRLWTRLAGKGLGVPATSRNWTTVEALLEMADA